MVTEQPANHPPTALRDRLRRLRASLSADDVARRSDAAMERVVALGWWGTLAHLAVYKPFDGELDPAALVAEAGRRGIATYVPVLAETRLRFARFDDSSEWRANRYGILEPVDTEVVEAAHLDLVLVPAVAVDRRGNRMGMGAGWYDRTFSWLATTARPADVALVAAVHDEQVVASLDPAPWDISMDAIVTPTASYLVN